jgi:acyl-CoA reductase-like NAD-dependent aldehyde dehydrogenase
VLGGADAVAAPYARPTILVDVPEDAAAVREETFGPTLTVARVRDADEGVRLANASRYGLGGAVFSRTRGVELARKMRSGMTSVNSAISFAGQPALPFGGVGDSGFGRIHGADGLREFSRPKAITKRRMRSPLPSLSFDRTPRQVTLITKAIQLIHKRPR